MKTFTAYRAVRGHYVTNWHQFMKDARAEAKEFEKEFGKNPQCQKMTLELTPQNLLNLINS